MKEKRGRICVNIFSIIFILFLCGINFAADKVGTGNLIGHVFDSDRTTPVSGAVVKAKNIKDGTIYTSSSTDSKGTFTIRGMREGIYVVGVVSSQGDFNTDNLIGIKKNQTAKIAFSLNPYEKEVSEAILDVYGEQVPSRVKAKRVNEDNVEVWEVRIGKVVNYIPRTGEAAVYIGIGLVQLGDEIRIKGYVTDFYQYVKRLSLDGQAVNRALAGHTPLIGVTRQVDIGDLVYLVCGKKGLGKYFRAPVGIASLIAGAGAIFWGAIVEVTEKEEESPFKK